MVYSTVQYEGEVTSTPGTHVERGLDVGCLYGKSSNECSKSEIRINVVREFYDALVGRTQDQSLKHEISIVNCNHFP